MNEDPTEPVIAPQPCERCGSDDAKWQPSPCDAELGSNDDPIWICDSCAYAEAVDI